MAFRADEAAYGGLKRAKNYLIPVTFAPKIREKSEEMLLEIINELGPVVEGYPTWHPLVSRHESLFPHTHPNEETGYFGLDHTIYLTHGFITCPYNNAEKVINSATSHVHDVASIFAEELDIQFYHKDAKPVLVKCVWSEKFPSGSMIPKKLAVPLMIQEEMRYWTFSNRAERWEIMRPYLLGAPHGSRSSQFVDQETALAMKKAYMSMVESGMFGPLKMD